MHLVSRLSGCRRHSACDGEDERTRYTLASDDTGRRVYAAVSLKAGCGSSGSCHEQRNDFFLCLYVNVLIGEYVSVWGKVVVSI